MSRLTFSAKALRGLDEILEFISKDNPRAAETLVDRIIRTCENLARFPNRGMLQEDLGQGIREYSVGKYVIYFRNVGDYMRIELIRHGARDSNELHFDP
jgi:toxin ParE1/3/4